jgi:hypothetical protein
LTLRIIQEDFKRELPQIWSVQREGLEERERTCSNKSQFPLTMGPITREITEGLIEVSEMSALQIHRLLMSFLSTDEPHQ